MVGLELIRPLAYLTPTLRATSETAITLLAATCACLLAGQFAHTHRLRHLLLLAATSTFALTELVGSTLPAMLQVRAANGLTAVVAPGQLLVAALLAASALTPADRLITAGRHALLITAALSAAVTGAAELIGLTLHRQLLGAGGYERATVGQMLQHPLALSVLLVTAALLTLAAVGFSRHGRADDRRFSSLLAGAALLLAAARICYLVQPIAAPDVLTPRELLCLLGVAVLLVGLVARELDTRATLRHAAALAERSKVAQDLHDGLAQDLAFIAAQAARLAGESGQDHPLVVAARRALAVSRGTISELSDVSQARPQEALDAVAHELRERFAIAIAVDVQPESELPKEAVHDVVRIAREAIANAARHGGAQNVVVSLRRTDAGHSLRVRDDGCGMREALGGFGLSSMRDRAVALGGSLAVRSRRYGGTDLKVDFR